MRIHKDTALEDGFAFPIHDDFAIAEREDGKGQAVYDLRGHARGELVARFTGYVIPYRTQHTLQITPSAHLLDMSFVGYLAHSCSPNVFVDMQSFEVWALEDIAPDTQLTMDYAATEDVLYKQFRCLCQSPKCRHWVTGRKEKVSEEGLAFLASFAH